MSIAKLVGLVVLLVALVALMDSDIMHGSFFVMAILISIIVVVIIALGASLIVDMAL